MTAGPRAFARAEAKGAVEHVERLAHLLRVRVRTEVHDPAAVPLSGEHHPRVLVLERHRDVGERLVVAQADVERRPVALDEALLEVERLRLGAGDDRLHVRDPLDELRRAEPRGAGALEVAADAGPQRLRLADVEDVALPAAEEVDARASGNGVEAGLECLVHPASQPSLRLPLRPSWVALSWSQSRRSRSPAQPRPEGRSSSWARPRMPSASRTVVMAKTQLDLLALAGLKAVRITSTWAPGLRAPEPGERNAIDVVADAAALTGTRVIVSVYHRDAATTPLTDGARDEFAAYTAAIARDNPTIRDFVIGNEPNLNRFWMPQFGPAGENWAASSYLALLVRCYDELKNVSPAIQVIGVAVSPRGNDRPDGIRPTHSPTSFITDLGSFYRQSGRTLPIMDSFGIHPYQDNSSTPPSFGHPLNSTIAIADYDKLVKLLGQAFDGTAQPGSTLPIFYGEFGVETIIPTEKSALYTGVEPASVRPVDNATQAAYYREALAMAFCQPNVKTFLFFHAVDESNLDRWQSGTYYVDGTPKPSMAAVAQATRDTRGGVIARCAALKLSPTAKASYPRGKALAKVPLKVKLTCDIDCNYRVRLERHPQGSTTLSIRGKALAGISTTVSLPPRRIAPGKYRFTVTLTAPVNTGPPTQLASAPVTLR